MTNENEKRDDNKNGEAFKHERMETKQKANQKRDVRVVESHYYINIAFCLFGINETLKHTRTHAHGDIIVQKRKGNNRQCRH